MPNNLGLVYGSEYLGTLFLILLGNGVVYSVSAHKMFANTSLKWMLISVAWGLAVLMGVIVGNAMDGPAHLNPAVTIYSLVSSKFHNYWALGYIVMQMLGAMSAQVILNFINWRHIEQTALGTVRACHCTAPAYSNKAERAVVFNFSYELVGTLVLLGGILAISRANINNLGPVPVALLVMVIGMSLGASTGYAINPARDLAPRIIYFFTEKYFLTKRVNEHVGANWGYSWVPVVAPSIAGVIIGMFNLIS